MIHYIGRTGKVCVGIFVFLTAYGMTKTYSKINFLNYNNKSSAVSAYVLRRYAKLLIGYWTVYILAVMTSFLRDGGIRAVYFFNGIKQGIIYAIVDFFGLSFYLGYPTLNETWWYISLAFILVSIIPVLIELYDRCGLCIVFASLLSSFYLPENSLLKVYLFCVTFGIMCSKEGTIEKISTVHFADNRVSLLLKSMILAILLFCTLVLRNYFSIFDAFSALILSMICLLIKQHSKYIWKGMSFLGKHSMNIFLVHTLIFEYYFRNFIYSPKYWIAICGLLLGICLIISVLIEKIKSGVAAAIVHQAQ